MKCMCFCIKKTLYICDNILILFFSLQQSTNENSNLDIGLTPVVTTKAKTKINGESNNNNNNNNNGTNPKNPKSQHTFLQSTTQKISTKIQLQYSRNGHASIRSMIPVQILQNMKQELIQHSKIEELEAWRQKVEVATKSTSIANKCTSITQCKKILQQQQSNNHNGNNGNNADIQIQFLQHFNIWQNPKSCPTVSSFVTSPFLSNLASQLLDIPTVRLYQDSLFHKRFEDGPTPWHSDARMAPFDTSNMITFWIPLDDIPSIEDGGTGLLFVDKSHCDFALPFWNPIPKCDDDDTVVGSDDISSHGYDVYGRLEERYGGDDSVKHYMPLTLGDCTVHAGWTLHCANGMMEYDYDDDSYDTHPQKDRYALAVTFVDGNAHVREGMSHLQSDKGGSELGHDEDRQSFRKWIDDVQPREYFEHELVPIVWPPSSLQ